MRGVFSKAYGAKKGIYYHLNLTEYTEEFVGVSKYTSITGDGIILLWSNIVTKHSWYVYSEQPHAPLMTI